jgi:hypothetical protein
VAGAAREVAGAHDLDADGVRHSYRIFQPPTAAEGIEITEVVRS